MKATIALMAVSLLRPLAVEAESASNLVRWQAPSNGIAAARWPMKGNSPFAISTNTDAFEAYGLDFMLAAANEMRIKWQLDISQPLTLNDVYFRVQATAHGIRKSVV